ncbi:MAG: RNA polymerase sigma factor, partial [Planctomycetaceae bacterium]
MNPEQLSFCPGSWNQLLHRAQAGDQEALNTLMLETRPWLLRKAAQKLSPELAEEAVQNTQVRLFKCLSRIDDGYLPGWLSAVLRNEILQVLNQESRSPGTLPPPPDHDDDNP